MGPPQFPRLVIVVGLIAFLAIAPFLLQRYLVHIIIICFIWAVVAMCWNLLLGFSGIAAFGNLLFFGVSAYATAYWSLKWGLSPWIALIVGGLLGILAGLIIGSPTMRLRGIYVALFTFASEELVRNVVIQTELAPWTGGAIGLSNIPTFTIAGEPSITLSYFMGLTIFLMTATVIYRLVTSRFGLAIVSIRESENFAAALGVNIYRHKMLVFIVAACFTGVAGSFYSSYLTGVSDETLSFLVLVNIIFMIVMGGLGSFHGPIIGAFLFVFLNEYLRGLLQYRLIIIGALIPLILVFFPRGIAGLIDRMLGIKRRV